MPLKNTHFSTLRILACALPLAALLLLLDRAAPPERPAAPVESIEELPPIPRGGATALNCGYVLNETFSNAPTEWRPAGAAVIEITNRWQCDPRWTFFCLGNDPKIGKAAALWAKRCFPGDVAVEFYFGIKMDRMRGEPYRYARDVNVTIGSDGSDLRKGITFSFGANGNTCSCITRDGTELVRVPATIPASMEIHRRWFKFRAERHGGKLLFQVDDFFAASGKRGELTVDDPLPLNGNRLAIWTYDNAIMLSRVRISGEGGIETESPDFAAEELKTMYDKE
ncbi:MAG TPA: hypothetical protein VKX17_13270 [Planctomycetota bacterium]|nr:hypothetical protein [Planctomycetota bacterium]